METRSGWSNLHAGLVVTTAGRILVPESDLLAGESNFLRFRKESPPVTGYSAPVTLTLDPTVNSASPNQVRSLAVSRSGNNILLRWSVATDNGKGFRIYFRPKDGGTTVLLTPQGLASTARSYTVSSQALASGCLEFFLRQFTVQGETADGPHTDLGTPLAGSDGRANDPCQPGGGSGSNAPSGYTFLEHFQMRDHLGSLRVVSDETGAVEEKLDFYPFGQEVSFGTLGDESERKYTGHQRDGRTGLDYMMARYKAPWMGSFQSPDPIDDVALDVPWSWNKYAYVRANPIGYVDPSGMLTKEECTELWKGTVEGDYCVVNGKRYDINGEPSGGTVDVDVTVPDPGDPEPTDVTAVINWLRWRRIQHFGPVVDFIDYGGGGPDRVRIRGLRCFARNWSRNFGQTNDYFKGLLAPTGAGFLTARRTAEVYRTLTLGEYIGGGFQGWQLQGVAYTGLETGVLASATAVMNGVFIGIAWEAGVAVGSGLNVAVGTVVAPEMLNYVCYEE